jgi:hypothetical protein
MGYIKSGFVFMAGYTIASILLGNLGQIHLIGLLFWPTVVGLCGWGLSALLRRLGFE